MDNNELYNNIITLFHNYNIGEIIANPESVAGGLIHKMYRVKTNTSDYAVKHLNPSIMLRNGVMENMIHSERIAYAFSTVIPVIAALSFNGKNVLNIHQNYYMVFDWVEGKSIFPPEISNDNCYVIGNILGRIHQLDLTLPEIKQEESEPSIYHWEHYLKQGLEQATPWLDSYIKVLDKLIIWTKKVNSAKIKLSEYMVLSHRDLDPKNVMWNHDLPYLIDWESAGYVNPYQELLEVLNYWADNGNGSLDKDKFFFLLQGYNKSISTKTVSWDLVLDSGYGGMLGWLEYSIKRALGIENVDQDERKLGEEQILGTITALHNYNSLTKTINEWLYEFNTL